MKKILLFMMSLFTAMTSMAQLVTPPESLETETYEMYCRDIIFGNMTLTNVKIGFDGEDVYLGNFGYYGDKYGAWLMGKVEGDMLVFAQEQMLWEDKGDEYYAYGAKTGTSDFQDFALKYDKDAGMCTSDMDYILTKGKKGGEEEHLTEIILMTAYDPGTGGEAPEIITFADGQSTLYSRQGYSWQYTMYGVDMVNQDGAVMNIVKDKDGKTVYLQDIICGTNEKTYVRGELSEDGSKITVAMGQFVHYNTKDQWGHKLAMLNFDEDSETYIADDTQFAVYSIKDGVLTLEDTDEDYKGEEGVFPKRILGLIYQDVNPVYDGKWASFGDVHTVLTPASAGDVELPDDVDVEQFALTFDKTSYTIGTVRQGQTVDVGISGSDIYIQGLSKDLPEAWVKGTIDGDKVIIPNNQKLGVQWQYLIYLLNGKQEQAYDEEYDEYYTIYKLVDEDIVLNYDAATKTLGAQNAEQTLIINAGNTEVYYLSLLVNPELYPHVDRAVKPATPRVVNLFDYTTSLGYTITDNYIPTFDVDGKFINPEYMTYKVYVTVITDKGEYDELFTFTQDEYWLIPEDMTEIPYNFSDGRDIYSGASSIFFYRTDISNYGIQSFCHYGGETVASEIGWYIEDEPDGIKQIDATSSREPQLYDMMGRKVSADYKGLVIRNGKKVFVK